MWVFVHGLYYHYRRSGVLLDLYILHESHPWRTWLHTCAPRRHIKCRLHALKTPTFNKKREKANMSRKTSNKSGFIFDHTFDPLLNTLAIQYDKWQGNRLVGWLVLTTLSAAIKSLTRILWEPLGTESMLQILVQQTQAIDINLCHHENDQRYRCVYN